MAIDLSINIGVESHKRNVVMSMCDVYGADLGMSGGYALQRHVMHVDQSIRQHYPSKINLHYHGEIMCMLFNVSSGTGTEARYAFLVHAAPNVDPPDYLKATSQYAASGGVLALASFSHTFGVLSGKLAKCARDIDIEVELSTRDRLGIALFYTEEAHNLTITSHQLIRDAQARLPLQGSEYYMGEANAFYAAAAYVTWLQSVGDYGQIISVGGMANMGNIVEGKRKIFPILLDDVGSDPIQPIDQPAELIGEDDQPSEFEYAITNPDNTAVVELIKVKLPDGFTYAGVYDGIVFVKYNGNTRLMIVMADAVKQMDNNTLRVIQDQARRLGTLAQAYRLLIP